MTLFRSLTFAAFFLPVAPISFGAECACENQNHRLINRPHSNEETDGLSIAYYQARARRENATYRWEKDQNNQRLYCKKISTVVPGEEEKEIVEHRYCRALQGSHFQWGLLTDQTVACFEIASTTALERQEDIGWIEYADFTDCHRAHGIFYRFEEEVNHCAEVTPTGLFIQWSNLSREECRTWTGTF